MNLLYLYKEIPVSDPYWGKDTYFLKTKLEKIIHSIKENDYISAGYALSEAFFWSKSLQGPNFWRRVHFDLLISDQTDIVIQATSIINAVLDHIDLTIEDVL